MSDLPLLVGEAPSRTGDRYWMVPLSGRVAQTMCEAAGIPPQEGGTRYGRWTWALYDAFDCRNLIERHQDAEPWPTAIARAKALDLLATLDSSTVVCLGRRVAAAFGLPADHPWGEWQRRERLSIAVVPHPSGRNRTLNDRHMRDLLGLVLRQARERALLEAREPFRPRGLITEDHVV